MPSKAHKNEQAALAAKAEAVRLRVRGSVDVPLLESLRFTFPATAPLVPSPEDDVVRERVFYESALSAVAAAYGALGREKITLRRPEDAYMEMLKDEAHMSKLKAALLKTQRRLEDAQSKRKQRDAAKFAKQVAAERAQARAKGRAADEDAIKKWRRLHGKSDSEPFPEELLDPHSALRQELTGAPVRVYAGLQPEKKDKAKQSKAQLKAQKYGMGGKRGKHWRSNTADSANDFSQWSTQRNKSVDSAFRPGKRARQAGKAPGPNKKQRRH